MPAFTVEWSPNEITALTSLTDHALPGERLTDDELGTLCFDDPDPGAVLATPDGDAAVALVARRTDPARPPVALLQFLAVMPRAQSRGIGRQLLRAAEEWAADQAGATEVVAGGAAPFYLWPGIDVRWTRALALFEAAGYRERGAVLNMSCPTTHRAPLPDGVTIERVLHDSDARRAADFCRRHWPQWEAELGRGIDHGAGFLASDAVTAEPLGFACHSVNRVGWVGPMGTHPDRRHRGLGSALLSALCADIRAAGLPDCEISWVGPIGFYARAAGASVSRVFRVAGKRVRR